MLSESYIYKSKLFFWIFGLLFSLFIISIIYILPFFESIINSSVILLIFLILIGLFFGFGLVFQNIPIKLYSLFYKKENINYDQFIKNINSQASVEEIRELVRRFRQIINTIASFKYLGNQAYILMYTLGLSKNHANRITKIIVKIKLIKIFFWFLGIVICVGVLLLIRYLPIFDFINDTIYLPILISVTIFLFFVLESFLFTKLPDSFYLDLIRVNKIQLIENKLFLEKQKETLKNKKEVKEKIEDDISLTIKYFMKNNMSENTIKGLLKRYSVSEDKIEKIISNVKKDNVYNNSKNQLKLTDATIKLSLAKLHESFSKLRYLDNKLKNISDSVDNLTEKQENIEGINKNNWNKYLQKILNKDKDSKKKVLEDIDSKKIKSSDISNPSKVVDFLYDMLLPHVKNHTQDELKSLLFYKGYSFELIQDVFNKFKENKIYFKNKISFQEKIINKINSLYDLF
jgi:hypothetical protein